MRTFSIENNLEISTLMIFYFVFVMIIFAVVVFVVVVFVVVVFALVVFVLVVFALVVFVPVVIGVVIIIIINLYRSESWGWQFSLDLTSTTHYCTLYCILLTVQLLITC